jgi:hypothetical protein
METLISCEGQDLHEYRSPLEPCRRGIARPNTRPLQLVKTSTNARKYLAVLVVRKLILFGLAACPYSRRALREPTYLSPALAMVYVDV